MSQFDFVIDLHTSEYRGDHAADTIIAIRPVVGETIEGLLARVRPTPIDFIAIRIYDKGRDVAKADTP